MAKTREKTHSEVEHLRGIIREQKSIIRNLKKRVTQLTKREHYYDNLTDGSEVDDETDVISDDGGNCPSCGKTDLGILDLYYAVYKVCDLCQYREKVTKEGV